MSSATGDLLNVLERTENQKLRSSGTAPNDPASRTSITSSHDPRYAGASNPTLATNATARPSSPAAAVAVRKKKNEPSISRTLSSFTNFFKGGNSASANPPQTPSANPAGVSATSPTTAKPASAMAVPARANSGASEDAPNLVEDDDATAMIAREFENDEEVGVLLASQGGSHVSPAPPPAGLPSSVQLAASADSPAGAKEGIRVEEDLDDEDWAPISASPTLSASVSRASMRELSRATTLMPKRNRVKKGHQTTTSDYLLLLNSKRLQSSRELPAVASTYAGPGPTLASSSSAISAQASISKSQMRRACAVIEQAIAETGIDLPLCSDCAIDVLADLHDESESLDSIISEYEKQLSLLSHRYFQEEKFSVPITNLERGIARLEHETASTRAKILNLAEEERALSFKGSELLVSKAEYWRQFEMHAADKEAMLENMISAHNRLTHAKKWLDLVRASHVLNDAFHVSVELHLATIGGLRVGRLPSAQVEWPEISAGLGLCLHMLQEMAQKASFTFTRYRLILDGSFCGLYRLPNGGTLNLHSDGDISLVRLVQFQGVNSALFAFVECVAELADHLKKQDPKFVLPFPIYKDQVAGVSVRRAWNSSGATWSSALRALMADLKFILAWQAKFGQIV